MGRDSTLSWEPMPSEESLQTRQSDFGGLDAYQRIANCDLQLGQEFGRFTPVDRQLYDPFVSFFPPLLIGLFILEHAPGWIRTALTIWHWMVG